MMFVIHLITNVMTNLLSHSGNMSSFLCNLIFFLSGLLNLFVILMLLGQGSCDVTMTMRKNVGLQL